jgi:hypothetical protein
MHGTLPVLGDTAAQLRSLATEANAEAAAADEHHHLAKEHARRSGLALVQAKRLVAHGQWMPWLRANFEKSARTARLYMQLAELPEAKWQAVAILPLCDVLRPALDERLASVEYYTGAKYIEAARRVLGAIDLDPASCAEANATVGAATFYTKEQDGLSLPWRGRVWLNPPYCGEAGVFITKLLEEYRAGNVSAAIALLSASHTDTAWFQPLLRDHLVCFSDHRIKCYGPQACSSPKHNSAFIYIGADPAAFVREFKPFGHVLARWRVSGRAMN